MDMMGEMGGKRYKLSKELLVKAHEVQATASLNASIGFYLQKNYKKSVEHAEKSL